MKLRYSANAQNDIASILDYFTSELEYPDVGERVIAEILQKAIRLEMFPESGVIIDDESGGVTGYRFIVIGKYLLVYDVREDTVEVARVVHASFDYTRLL